MSIITVFVNLPAKAISLPFCKNFSAISALAPQAVK